MKRQWSFPKDRYYNSIFQVRNTAFCLHGLFFILRESIKHSVGAWTELILCSRDTVWTTKGKIAYLQIQEQYKHNLGKRITGKLNQQIFVEGLGLSTEMPWQRAPLTELLVRNRKMQLRSSWKNKQLITPCFRLIAVRLRSPISFCLCP